MTAQLNLTRDEVLDTYGVFSKDDGVQVFVETSLGNFLYFGPGHGCTLTFVHYSRNEWLPSALGHHLGTHRLRDFCSQNVKVLYELR